MMKAKKITLAINKKNEYAYSFAEGEITSGPT